MPAFMELRNTATTANTSWLEPTFQYIDVGIKISLWST